MALKWHSIDIGLADTDNTIWSGSVLLFLIGDELARYEVLKFLIVLPLVFSVAVDLRWRIHPMLRVVGVNSASSFN